MDLVGNGVDASKSISANQQEWGKFDRQAPDIYQLLYNPLKKNLRLMQNGATLQSFDISEKEVIGRQFTDKSQSAFDQSNIC